MVVEQAFVILSTSNVVSGPIFVPSIVLSVPKKGEYSAEDWRRRPVYGMTTQLDDFYIWKDLSQYQNIYCILIHQKREG